MLEILLAVLFMLKFAHLAKILHQTLDANIFKMLGTGENVSERQVRSDVVNF